MPAIKSPALVEKLKKRKAEPTAAASTPVEKPKKRKASAAATAATPVAAPVSAKKAPPSAKKAPPSAKKAKTPPAAAAKKGSAAAASSRLSEEQVSKAVKALCHHLEGAKTSLLDDETGSTMHLQIALNKARPRRCLSSIRVWV